MIRRAVLLLLLAAQPPTAARCRAQEPQSFALTSDTPAYCAQLARQIVERHSPVLDVQRLLAEGREMCDRGQIRGGIRRLRHALVLLHHKNPG